MKYGVAETAGILGIDIYHIGASRKDLGKKWFAFSKMEMGVVEMLSKVNLI